MAYILILILLYFIIKTLLPIVLVFFNLKKKNENINQRQNFRSKINKSKILDAEFEEK
tara:strand:- start:823 stop:996 length:174 start_codon:yes stop_codon:yes gene_type:complete